MYMYISKKNIITQSLPPSSIFWFLWGSCCSIFRILCSILSFSSCSFGHCSVSSLVYGFWLHFWYFQTFITLMYNRGMWIINIALLYYYIHISPLIPDSCRATGKKLQQHRANGKDYTIDSDWNAVRMFMIFQ